MRRWLAAALALVSLSPLALGAQMGGDAGHAAVAVPSSAALDVVGRVEVWPSGTVGDLRMSPVLLPVGGVLRGAVGAPAGDGGCKLVETDLAGNPSRTVAVPACDGSAGLPVLSAAEPGWNLLCRKGVPAESPVLLAVDDDGHSLWTVSAAGLFPFAGTGAWSCIHAVQDGDRVVATIVDATPSSAVAELAGRNGVLAVAAGTGEVEWLREVTLGDTAGDLAGSQVNGPSAGGHPTFTPLTLTATTSGYVVMGDVAGARTAVLLGWDGDYEETFYASETPLGRPYTRLRGTVVDETADETLRPSLGSAWAVATGSLAYLALGPEILALDPSSPNPVAIASPDLAFPFQPHAGLGPLLVNDRLVVPFQGGVLAVGRADLGPLWHHRMNTGTGYWMWDIAASASGDVWLAGVVAGSSESASLQLVSAAEGHLLQELPLNLSLVEPQVSFAHSLLRIVPTPDGFLVLNMAGEGVRLGPAPAGLAPRLEASTRYPAPGDEVRLGVRTPFGTTTTVHWGDGLSTKLVPGESAAHRFDRAGDVAVRATTLFPDGRTATSVLAIHVGGTPPPELTFLQQAFAPERQDTTWGVIGIVVAFFGGIGAYAANSWRRRGVKRHLRTLDQLRTLAAAEPLDALEGLRAFRRDLRRQAERGSIDGSQYASLLHEAERLGRAVEVRIWGVLQGRLGPALRGAVEAALTDGYVAPQEQAALRQALRRERRLSDRERAAFGRLLDGWSAA